MTPVGDQLVVWQRRATSTFTVLGSDGAVLATGGATIQADWAEPTFRLPLLNLLGTQFGPEDITRRLAALGDSGFVVQLQLNEKEHIDWRAPIDFPTPAVYLIRYGLDARVRDTLATMAGPPTLLWNRLATEDQTLVIYEQPLFSPRPVWAIGENWLALSHGDSSYMVIRRFSGDTVLVVRWPDRRSLVSDRDKIEAAKWVIAHRILNSTESRQMYQLDSPRGRRKGIEFEAFEVLSFAELAPTITAAYGAGACLFLAGYAPADWADATALTWIALNVEKGTVQSVFRLSPPEDLTLELERRGGAVRDFDRRFAYTYHRDEDGVFLVQRYPLPDMDCED